MPEADLPVLKTYAKALDAALRQAGATESQALEEARALAQVAAEQPGLLAFLARPAVPREDKKALLDKVFGARVSPVMLHLPMLLVDKNRGGEWAGILRAYIELVERRAGIYPAEVVTAGALDDSLKNDLQRCLEKFAGAKLDIAFRQDPAAIGGVLFRYDDAMIDNTVRGALRELGRRLRAVSPAPGGDAPSPIGD